MKLIPTSTLISILRSGLVGLEAKSVEKGIRDFGGGFGGAVAVGLATGRGKIAARSPKNIMLKSGILYKEVKDYETA
ncbi:MAG: hypothetical protein RMK75_00010 [Aquificaceae bacterium]|nr:hypothetical protein [Aquificaceae bacterium]MCS7277445.1 hypothetical protein [Aquificaceae bacterium]MDW8066862.1 hypothetical protein [Aquificaceae bacterium]MDW8422695.1 hypothetical protein [Aquificaceae bacterium]